MPEPLPNRHQPTTSELAVVIVLYNSASEIGGCLATLPAEAQVLVVDNASSDDGAERARAARPDAEVIRSQRNLGFGGGCNLGWRAADRPYVAFVNPDVRLHDGTLATLLLRLAAEEHSVVGPAMVDSTGAARPCKRRPSAMMDVIGTLPSAARWAPAGWDGKLDRRAEVHVSGGSVASLEGACFVVRRSDLEEVGGFDEDLFLYYEEDSLALRLARLGGRAIYEPRAVAEHAGAASTRRVAAIATHHFHRSRVVFYRKRDGNLRGELAGLMLVLAALISIPTAIVNHGLGRHDHTTPSELKLVVGGLLAGMTSRLTSGVRYRGSGPTSPSRAGSA